MAGFGPLAGFEFFGSFLSLWLVLSFGAGFGPLGWFWALGEFWAFGWFCAFCWLWVKEAGADWGWGQELGAAGWAWPGLD